MLKIALFCDTTETVSGIVRYCNLLKDLLETHGDCKVSIFSNIPYKRFAKCLDLYNKDAIKEALLSEDFDVIHINGFISTIPYLVYSAIQSLKLKAYIVYTPHAHPFYTLNHPFRNRIFFHLFVKKILKKANFLVSINKEDYHFFCKYNKNVITIPHWSTREIFSSKKGDEKALKLLFVGRNNDNKNLKALYSIKRNKYQVTCVTNIKPKREDFIFRTGLTDKELIDLYCNSSLTVIPSKYEAFSYTALESLLAGTPILVSDKVRIVDFLDGVSGVTQFKYGDEKDFCDKIDKALRQKVDVDKVKDIFAASKAFEKYIYIYTRGMNLRGGDDNTL